MQVESSLDKRKLLSALAHGSIFISALVLSIGSRLRFSQFLKILSLKTMPKKQLIFISIYG